MAHLRHALALAGSAFLLLAAGEAPTLSLDPARAALVQLEPIVGALAEPAETPPHAAGMPSSSPESSERDGLIDADIEPEVSAPVFRVAPPRTLSEALRHAEAEGLADAEHFDCLAQAVYFESKGEPLEGQLAVARVILNRVASPRFPDTICGVVRQPRQFSFVRHGAFPPIRDRRAFEVARGVAAVALEGSWSNSAQRATHFHARRVSPGWRLERVAMIGNHIFYR